MEDIFNRNAVTMQNEDIHQDNVKLQKQQIEFNRIILISTSILALVGYYTISDKLINDIMPWFIWVLKIEESWTESVLFINNFLVAIAIIFLMIILIKKLIDNTSAKQTKKPL